jgi:hypothetical protein
LVRICAAFSWQSVEKLALAEGEKFVLVLSGSQHNQGVYGIVEKLGESVRDNFTQMRRFWCGRLANELALETRAESLWWSCLRCQDNQGM